FAFCIKRCAHGSGIGMKRVSPQDSRQQHGKKEPSMKQFLISVMALVLGLTLVNAVEAKNSTGGKNRGRSSRTTLGNHPKNNKRLTSTGKKTKRKKGKGNSVKGNRRGKGKFGKGNSVKGNRRGKGKFGKGNSVKGNRRGKGKFGKGNLAKNGKG